MKKLTLLVLGGVLSVLPLMADTRTWTDPDTGYTWTYQINGGTAAIYNGSYSAAISPSPTGAVTIPSTLGGKSVTGIGFWAFYNCTNLTSVTIPDSVTSIGDHAFRSCRGLTNMMIPSSVTSIGYSSIAQCSNLTSVTIPDGVTSIGGAAFSQCSSLRSVTIGNGVTSIGANAFYGCTNLTSMTIPNSVTSIGEEAFYKCSGLTSVTIPNSVTNIGGGAFDDTPFYNNQPDGLVVLGKIVYTMKGECPAVVTIPDNVTSISPWAFYNCTNLTSVTIPNSVTSIDASAFWGCNSIRSITVPQYVFTSVLSNVFSSTYKNITNVVVQKDVEYIPNRAFFGCAALRSVYFLGDAPYAVGDIFANDTTSPAPYGVVLYVQRDSVGWSSGDAGDLPALWPNDEYGRRIRFYGGTSSGGDPSAGDEVATDARYALTDRAADRSIASVTVSSDSALDDFVLTDGKVYDTVLYVVNTATAPVRLTLPAGHTYVTVSGLAPLLLPASSTNLVTITRMAADTFLVTRQGLEVVK